MKTHVNEKEYVIYDWAGNLMFNSQRFDTFEDADEYLTEFIIANYPNADSDDDEFSSVRGEFYIDNEE